MQAPINNQHPLCGVWHDDSLDTEDYYRSEYSISAIDGRFHVSGVDRSDGEEFIISDIRWDGEWLSFKSLMPSTQRRGENRMRLLDTNEIEFLFTFTSREVWKRKRPT
jgi:hypothetical protein